MTPGRNMEGRQRGGGRVTSTYATCSRHCIKAPVAACLLALCVTGALASDKINAADWVSQCATTDERHGRCAAPISEVVTLIDNYQYLYPHFIVCWKPQPLSL